MYQINEAALARLYAPQKGKGLDNLTFYKSNYRRQRGDGLGSIFGSIARHLIPFAKNILWPAAKKFVLPHAKRATENIVSDVIEGKNLKESIKQHGKTALKAGASQVLGQSQSGGKGKRKARKPIKGRKRKAAKSTSRNKRIKLYF